MVVWGYDDLEEAVVPMLCCQGMAEGEGERRGEDGGLAFHSLREGTGEWFLMAEPVGWEGGEAEAVQRLGVELSRGKENDSSG